MLARPRKTAGHRPRPSLATLAVIGLCLAFGGSGVAVAAPSAHGGHRCKCGMNCGSVCCCSRHEESRPPTPKQERKAPAATATGGPCVASAPCGGALPPPSSRSLPRVADPADRAGMAGLCASALDSLLPPPTSDRARGGWDSRPDEPPERIADA